MIKDEELALPLGALIALASAAVLALVLAAWLLYYALLVRKLSHSALLM